MLQFYICLSSSYFHCAVSYILFFNTSTKVADFVFVANTFIFCDFAPEETTSTSERNKKRSNPLIPSIEKNNQTKVSHWKYIVMLVTIGTGTPDSDLPSYRVSICLYSKYFFSTKQVTEQLYEARLTQYWK
jgi:hypothetical protein